MQKDFVFNADDIENEGAVAMALAIGNKALDRMNIKVTISCSRMMHDLDGSISVGRVRVDRLELGIGRRRGIHIFAAETVMEEAKEPAG